MHRLVITPGQLTLQDMRRLLTSPTVVSLEPSAYAAIDASVATVAGVIDEGRTAYGVNTGFGLLAQTRIERERLEDLQRSLVLSHATGVGERLDDELHRKLITEYIDTLEKGGKDA